MSEKRPDTFSDLFDHESFYSKVEKRKQKLIQQLKTCDDPEFPLTRVFNQKYSTDKLFDYMRQYRPNNENNFCDDPPSISFRANNGTSISCDYLCIELARPFQALRTSIRRYTYFEVYYGDYIFSCLMDFPSFQKATSFPCLDMDTREWAHLKQQLAFWNKIVSPDIEEIEIDSAIPKALSKRLQKYRKFANSKEFDHLEHNLPAYPGEEGNLLWPVATYLSLLQILPVLPNELIPRYAINFVCRDEDTYYILLDKLQQFLENFCAYDPYTPKAISTYTNLLSSKDSDRIPGEVRPYILSVQRPTILTQLLTQTDHFSASEGTWERHPFLYDVPILVSRTPSEDSTILNLIVSPEAAKQLDPSTVPERGFRYFFADLADDAEESLWPDKHQFLESFKKHQKKLLKLTTNENAVKYQRHLFSLAVCFLMLYRNDLWNSKISEPAVEWFNQVTAEWVEQYQTMEKAVPPLLRRAAQILTTVKSGTPYDEDEFLYTYDGVFCKGNQYLCFHKKTFENLLAKEFPSISYKRLLDYMFIKGIIKTNAANDDNDYTVRIGNGTIRTTSFYIEKLPHPS